MRKRQRRNVGIVYSLHMMLIIWVLIFSAQCQKGRGTSTRGNTSFGGSSYSRSGSTSSRGTASSSRSSYSTGYFGNNYYPRSNSRGGYDPSSGPIIGYGFAALFSICCCSGLGWLCCKSNSSQVPNQPTRIQANNLSLNEGVAQNNTFNLDREFQRLRLLKNKVSYNTMTVGQFQIVKDQFINLIMHPNSIFSYRQGGQMARISHAQGMAVYQNDFLYKIQLQAKDEVGAWIGRVYHGLPVGPYVWWMKDYRDKQATGQTGDSQFLIYESSSYNSGYWTGRWYFEGDEFDEDYSGDWILNQNRQTDTTNPFMLLTNKLLSNN